MNTPFHGEYDKAMFRKGLALVERTPVAIRTIRVASLVFAVGVIGMGVYDWINSGMGVPDTARMIRDLITSALLGYTFASPYISRWQSTAKVFGKDVTREMMGSFNNDGITIQTPSGKEGFFGWEKFIRKGSRDQLTALVTFDGVLAVFHRDLFENESDWKRFNQFVNQKVKEPR